MDNGFDEMNKTDLKDIWIREGDITGEKNVTQAKAFRTKRGEDEFNGKNEQTLMTRKKLKKVVARKAKGAFENCQKCHDVTPTTATSIRRH